ncbi:hypothetical protein [Limosilactobacillus equigenerosi]|uniref:hypothetical protein n=1 Tax=Limosilactobacillus equigenerosi TaxID=417373 RepID=UPI0006D0AFBD|nr:hypothetical protein [Limosilactobacillus equigenerosi]
MKPIPNVKMRWLLINGFLGDALADWKISKPDKYADLDVFKFANSNQLMSRQLQQIYGQTSGNLANQRNQTQKSISGDVIRTAALTSVATLGLFALGVFKKAKELVIGAYNESKKIAI